MMTVMQWKFWALTAGIVLIVLGGAFAFFVHTVTEEMTVSSIAFENGKQIPAKYTCEGVNVSPPLTVMGIPKKAKSLAVIVYDPDVPKTGWVHWLAFGMPPQSEIPEGITLQPQFSGLNSFKESGYSGPCPPTGTHHYTFTVYAVSTAISFVKPPDMDTLKRAMKGNVLARAQMTGVYTHQ